MMPLPRRCRPPQLLRLLLCGAVALQALLVLRSLRLPAATPSPAARPRPRTARAPPAPPPAAPRPVAAFWWPDPDASGGFLGAIHRAQHPRDCAAGETRYLVARSLGRSAEDNRGLSAWASITMQHMLHAFSDGDDPTYGRRVLLTDDKLWPMAKGCRHGPETRECYFLPLSHCRLSDADPPDGAAAAVLAGRDDAYDRRARTLYSSEQRYARLTTDKAAWTRVPWRRGDVALSALTAQFLAYNLRVRPWLRRELAARLRRALPADLDPARTVGVPLRRSDKCFGHGIAGSAGGELDCPPLEEYLAAVKNFTAFDPLIRNVIVTSEDAAACADFIAMLKRELPTLRIVTNVGDVQQGTGSASKLEAYKDAVDNAEVVASALTSFHMHLRARYFVLTTKSIWTSSIAIFARTFGFAADVYVLDIGRNKNAYADLARRGG